MHIRTNHSGYEVCAMYRFVVFLALALTVSADIPDNIKDCIQPMIYPPQCCKTFKNKHPMDDDTFKECMLIPSEPGSCERDICFATKKGFASADGTIKMEVLQKHLDEAMSDNKDVVEAIKKKCIEGDFEKYGEPDDCSLRKLANCIRWQHKWGCPEFNEDGPCKGIKEVAKKCLELDS
ncbi:uncharacterized protein [Epargyreus clarus]|uniref:uncharacterized protein n=1 Tax=Epargyreus clarus TaxID=520877 RepID=UPI003C304DAC